MDKQKANHLIAAMARVFELSPSDYYGWKARGGNPSARAAEDQSLIAPGSTRIPGDLRGSRAYMELRLGQQTMVGSNWPARLEARLVAAEPPSGADGLRSNGQSGAWVSCTVPARPALGPGRSAGRRGEKTWRWALRRQDLAEEDPRLVRPWALSG